MALLPQEQRYSYADLLAWDDNTRYELYDGQPVALASPSNIHQEILSALHYQFYDYLRTCIHKRLSRVWKWEIMTIVSAEDTEIS